MRKIRIHLNIYNGLFGSVNLWGTENSLRCWKVKYKLPGCRFGLLINFNLTTLVIGEYFI